MTGPGLSWTVAVAGVGLALAASVHVVLHKRHPRSAVGWIGLIWLSPALGVALYLLLGVNRLPRREIPRPRLGSLDEGASLPEEPPGLARLVGEVTGAPLLGGNQLQILEDGEAAYPRMLEAIEGAERSIALQTYIFQRDALGLRFVEALGRAVERGVRVRVLVDGVGARYSWPTVVGALRRRRVPVQLFLASPWPWRMPYLNTRNHRKTFVVDGCLGFTGGMNLRGHHLVRGDTLRPTRDLVVAARGPVVAQLLQVFAEDWRFTTGERLEGTAWWPELEARGQASARAVDGGPDREASLGEAVFLGALASARERVRVLTPYFLPGEPLVAGLQTAARRGVRVELLLPGRSNLPYVDWAARTELLGLLAAGVRVAWGPPPFDHSKLLVVDEAWVLLGSRNWDARSLRLNLELDLEVYDAGLARRCGRLFDERWREGRPVTGGELLGRGLPIRLRDGLARLFQPYL